MSAQLASVREEPRSSARPPVVVVTNDDGSASEIIDVLSGAELPIVGLIPSTAELMEAPKSGSLEVVIVLCGDRSGGDEARQVLSCRPDARVVVVTGVMKGGAAVRRATEGGAAGFVHAEQARSTLVATVRAVAVGQQVVPFVGRQAADQKTLTVREKQVLALVVLGLRNGEIAARLYLAESTVKSHLHSAFGKLGVRSRNQAAAVILDPQSGLGTGILTIPTGSSRAPSSR